MQVAEGSVECRVAHTLHRSPPHNIMSYGPFLVGSSVDVGHDNDNHYCDDVLACNVPHSLDSDL